MSGYGYAPRRTGKPRVIRRVIKTDAKGRPKIARDRRTYIQMERVVARTRKPCTYHACPFGFIAAGVPYAKVSDPERVKRVGVRYVPDPKDYHFDCVPPEARPLVRFLR